MKQLNTLPELHSNHCLTTDYSETTAHFNGNFDTDDQIYLLYHTTAKVHSDFLNALYMPLYWHI
jgi:hypothetical protein